MSKFRAAELIEVIMVDVAEGKGTNEDPFRRVIYFVSKEGKLLAKTDPEEIEHLQSCKEVLKRGR